ncbi:MAG: carboxylesterase family protein [Desulfovibrio sp.]|nr:carboxylesterase family protein [Desulfovibrio sp.]MBI4958451.1 carboxylesterase family protein [Desulfovibrio sp.]
MKTHILVANFFFLLLSLPGVVLAGESRTGVVLLDSGPVRGKVEGGIREFLGIPYAAPPVGELRWKPPQAVAAWTTVRNATAFGPACPQSGPLEPGCAEDCLSLNVWTPARKAGDKLPVMVWIHGGGFNFGATSQSEYHGRNLAGKGVVVVTVNYRLGPLGFFVHPQLAAESGKAVAGNYGLLDQIEALQWVRRNIAAFGGDPDQVTIFGQSAGSRSVSLLTLSPLAKGLFCRAIAQSGGPIIGSEYLNPFFDGNMPNVSRMGETLGDRLGCPQGVDALSCMRAKPASEVIKAADCSTGLFDEGLFFAPVFDGWVVPSDVRTAFSPGAPHDVPMIVGSTGDEGTVYLRGEKDLSLAKYQAFLNARFGQDTAEALAMFPAKDDRDVYQAINRFITVAVNAQPARLMARTLAEGNSKAFLYRFTRRPNTAKARELAAFHGVDLAYVFGNMADSEGYTAADRELSRQVMAYWVNFAKTGDPNGPGLPAWPAYDARSDSNLNFADTVQAEQHLYQRECDFIDKVSRFRPN